MTSHEVSAAVPAAVPEVVSVSDPGELIAATPVLLGFPPRSSLVAMALGGASGARLGLSLRIDLPPPEHTPGAAESVVRGILLDDPSAVVVLVVGPGGDAGPPAAELVDRVVAGLESRGVDVPLALWAESTEGGSRWQCYDACACTGIVPGADATPLVVAAIAEGRVVRGDRTELERLVAPADEDRIRRREAMLLTATEPAFSTVGTGRRGADGVIEGIAALDAALDAAERAVGDVAACGTGGVALGAADDVVGGVANEVAVGAAAGDPLRAGDGWLDDDRAVGLVWALQVPLVREAAIASCTGSRPQAAEALWAALARGVPDPEAAEPAALLALSALLRGDGALANVALERAEAAWPGHRFTATLRGLALAGIRPSELRACLTGARSSCASELR